MSRVIPQFKAIKILISEILVSSHTYTSTGSSDIIFRVKKEHSGTENRGINKSNDQI